MELTDNVLWLLKQAFYFSLTTVNDAVKPHGVSTSHVGVLRQLAGEPGLSTVYPARRISTPPQGTQLGVNGGERGGLVWRRTDPPQGRSRKTFLAEPGGVTATAVINDAICAHDKVFGVLNHDEQVQLRTLLGRVVEQGTGHTLADDHVES